MQRISFNDYSKTAKPLITVKKYYKFIVDKKIWLDLPMCYQPHKSKFNCGEGHDEPMVVMVVRLDLIATGIEMYIHTEG